MDKKEYFAYYVEIFDVKHDAPFIFQSKLFKTKRKAINWYRNNVDYVFDDLIVSIMGLFGEEENYDIYEVCRL